MKCNKCYQIIPPQEEIKADHKCYCETCYKSDNLYRKSVSTASFIFASFILLMFSIFLCGFVIWILRKMFKKEPKEKKEEDD